MTWIPGYPPGPGFGMWRCVAEHNTGSRRERDGAAQTLALTKSGYEDKLTQQRMVHAEDMQRLRDRMKVMEAEAARDGPSMFTSESAAAAAAAARKSISEREGRAGLATALAYDGQREETTEYTAGTGTSSSRGASDFADSR